ncbi:hypothetical protein [Deinococcus sp. Leaf326]|uniref:hypothetical protein n=1 Tax=Deinococcus sp. Leaf326 TaxID=1736338 RepID=UPI000A3FF863|nr:hypothetical protein [Deinococcus sp. Leaf326]
MSPPLDTCVTCNAALDDTGECGDCLETADFTDLEAHLDALLRPSPSPLTPRGG